jgi:hypothetical protein
LFYSSHWKERHNNLRVNSAASFPSFLSHCIVVPCYSGYQIKQYEMGEACGTYGKKRTAYGVMIENLNGNMWLKDLSLDTKMGVDKIEWAGLDWIQVAQVGKSGEIFWTYQWIFGLHKLWKIYWTVVKIISLQKWAMVHGVSFLLSIRPSFSTTVVNFSV